MQAASVLFVVPVAGCMKKNNHMIMAGGLSHE